MLFLCSIVINFEKSMNISTIDRVIADQYEEISSKDSEYLIIRDIHEYAKKFLSEKIIKVITGIRRSGKSTFCHQLLKGQEYAYINFDDERLINLKTEELDTVLERLLIRYNHPQFLLFDEIQNVAGWELFINRLHRKGYNILLTGSNSKMLSRELATHLTGRHIQIELMPFSFKEFIRFKSDFNYKNDFFSTNETAEIQKLLNEYIEFGGFPEISNNDNKHRYIRDLFDKIILRDIVERFNIRDVTNLKQLGVVALNYYASLISFNKLNNSLEIGSINTVKDFLAYFEETYLLSFLNKFSFKIKEEIRSPRKVYANDLGFISAFETSLSPNIGRKYENLVYLNELRKGNEIKYFSGSNFEIDFVIKTNQKIKLIQVSQNIQDEKTLSREINAFIKASDYFENAEYHLINESQDEIIKKSGITIKLTPLWKYLISE